jgi:tetratricopeptide (TPR) repeat protein
VRIRLGGAHPIAKRAESLFMIAKQRYLRDGDVDGAARLFDESLRLSPTFARPYAYKARMARDDGDREAAIGWLRRGVEADPESWRTWHNLGRLLIVAERWDEAAPALTRAVALFPDDVGGRLALARALYAVGDWDGYRTHTEHVVKVMRALRDAKVVDDLKKLAPKVRLVDDPEEFFEKFQRWGPGAALPPMPDTSLIIGWNQD